MQRRRTKILVNPKFQLRFSLYISSWVLGLSILYPWLIYNLFDYFMRYAAVDSYGPTLVALYRTRTQVITLLVLLELLFLGVIFLISLFLSHRIAGPLHKLNAYMQEAAKGNNKGHLTFRKFDHFKELAKSYNAMVDVTHGRKKD